MDAETGLNRIAKVVEILGAVWAVLFALLAGALFTMSDASDKGTVAILSLIVGAIGYAVGYAIAWVVKGFAQKKG